MIIRLAATLAFLSVLLTTSCQTQFLTGADEESTTPLFKQGQPFTGSIKNIRIKQRTGGEGYWLIVKVEGTEDDIVTIRNVEGLFNEPIVGPSPLENPLTLKCVTNVGDAGIPGGVLSTCTTYIAASELAENAIGETYNITATMLDIDQNVLGLPFTTDVTVEPFEEDQGLHVAITEVDLINLGDGVFQIRLTQNGLDLSSTSGILISTEGALTRIRRRPDLLLADWDDLIDQDLQKLFTNPDHKPSGILVARDAQGKISGSALPVGSVVPFTINFAVLNADNEMEAISDGSLTIDVTIPEKAVFANSPKLRGGKYLNQIDLTKKDGSIYGGVKPDVTGPGVSVQSIWKLNFDPKLSGAVGVGVHLNSDAVLNCTYDPDVERPKIEYFKCLNTTLMVTPGNNTVSFGQASAITTKYRRILVVPYGDDGAVVGNKRWIKVRVSKKKAYLKINHNRFRMLGDNTISMGVNITYHPGESNQRHWPYYNICFPAKSLGLKPIAFRTAWDKWRYKKYGMACYTISKNVKNEDGSPVERRAYKNPGEYNINMVMTAEDPSSLDGTDIFFHISGKSNPLKNTQKVTAQEESNPHLGSISASYGIDSKKLRIEVSGANSDAVAKVGVVLVPTKKWSPSAKSCDYDPSASNPRVDYWRCLSDGLDYAATDDGASGDLVFSYKAKGKTYQPKLVGYDSEGLAIFSHITGPPIVLPDPRDCDCHRRGQDDDDDDDDDDDNKYKKYKKYKKYHSCRYRNKKRHHRHAKEKLLTLEMQLVASGAGT